MLISFLQYLKDEKRYSPHTLTAYRKDIEDFLKLCEDNVLNPTLPEDATKAARIFVQDLSQQNRKPASINRKISSVRQYYSFLIKNHKTSVNPFDKIHSLKNRQELHLPPSIEEMQALTEYYDELDPLKVLLIEMLYQTGLRRSEICNLPTSAVDLKAKWLKVSGKGNKQHFVPLSDDLHSRLTAYHQSQEEDRPYFFLTDKGKKISDKFVYLAVKEYLSLITTKKKKSPHMLRHAFATHLLNSGAEIAELKKLLGHSSLSTTERYTHTDVETLKSIVQNLHPRSKK